MDPQAATASDAATDPALLSGSKDGDAARHERRLVVLDELMEAGLRFALAIEAQVTVPDAPRVVEGPDLPSLALAFHRASRAVRMTVALQARLIEEAQRPDGAVPAAEPRTVRVVLVETDGTERPLSGGRLEPEPAPLPPGHSKAEVQDILRQVAKAGLMRGERSPREDNETAERLAREGVERLERESEFEAIMRRPVSEIIDLICRDLGLHPNWPRLADEAWALEEIASERVGAPLAEFSSPASGGGGPRSGGGGAGPPQRPFRHGAARRATSPACGGGEGGGASPEARPKRRISASSLARAPGGV